MNRIVTRVSAILMSVAILSVSIMSCTSTTMINTVPQGAKVYMNDEIKGTTPYKHVDSAISLTSTELTLKKEGYEDFYTTLTKNEQVDVGAVIGGVFFVFPFIWTMGYNPSHTYELYPMQ